MPLLESLSQDSKSPLSYHPSSHPPESRSLEFKVAFALGQLPPPEHALPSRAILCERNYRFHSSTIVDADISIHADGPLSAPCTGAVRTTRYVWNVLLAPAMDLTHYKHCIIHCQSQSATRPCTLLLLEYKFNSRLMECFYPSETLAVGLGRSLTHLFTSFAWRVCSRHDLNTDPCFSGIIGQSMRLLWTRAERAYTYPLVKLLFVQTPPQGRGPASGRSVLLNPR